MVWVAKLEVEDPGGCQVAGDWLTTIGPFMRDISSNSSSWWDEVMKISEDA